jgi:citrate lyase subunit beta/citryl-CoA lyase
VHDAEGAGVVSGLGVAWLFCPADRPERFDKAAAAADVVILDLEDGVSPADRPAARAALVASALDPARTVVRVNPVGTPDHAPDLYAVKQTPYTHVMLAKSESAAQADSLAPLTVFALCETPRGALKALEIAESPAVGGLMWGAEDLMAGLGGQSSRGTDGTYRDVAKQAKSLVLLAAGAAGKLAIDAVYLNIKDLDGLSDEAYESMQIGFGAKALIHPSHVEVVRTVYRPSAKQVDWARRVTDAATREPGVFAFEGKMVDEPVLRQARAILIRGTTGHEAGR